MTKPVTLLPLKCTQCTTPVPAEPDEIAWRCSQCGQGLLLDENDGLRPLDIHFIDGISPSAQGRPFWVVHGDVSMNRETYTAVGRKSQDAFQFWGQTRQFFVPAFNEELDVLLNVGTTLLCHPPVLQEGQAVDFAPVTLPPEDVPAMAEFIVVAIEAERRDKVKKIDFSLQLGEPSLWILL